MHVLLREYLDSLEQLSTLSFLGPIRSDIRAELRVLPEYITAAPAFIEQFVGPGTQLSPPAPSCCLVSSREAASGSALVICTDAACMFRAASWQALMEEGVAYLPQAQTAPQSEYRSSSSCCGVSLGGIMWLQSAFVALEGELEIR